MPTGLDRREVTQVQETISQNTPLLRGQASSVGSTILPYGNPNQDAVNSLLKFAGTTVQTQLAKKKEQNVTEGILAYTAGKSAEAVGYNPDALKAYKALEIKSRINDWVIQSSKKIDTEDYKLTPEEYRERTMSEIDIVQSSITDPDQRAVLATVAAGSLEKVIGLHVVKHQDFVKTTGKNNLTTMLVSSAEADDSNLDGILTNVEALTPTLNEEDRKEAILSAIRLNFASGSASVYETLGGMDGMLSRGYSPEKVQGLESTYKKTVEKYTAEANTLPDAIAEEHIKNLVESGEIQTPEDAFRALKTIKDPKRQAAVYKLVSSTLRKNLDKEILNNAYTKSIIIQGTQDIVDYRELRPNTLEEINTLPPNVRNKVREQLNSLEIKLNTDAQVKQTKEFYSKSLDEKRRKDIIDSQINKYLSGDKTAVNLDFQTLKDSKIPSVKDAQTYMLDKLVDNTVSNIVLDDSVPADAKDSEINKRLVSFIKDFDVVSNKVAVKFKNLDTKTFLNADNEIDQSYIDALELYSTFKKHNVSESKIAVYTGSTNDLLELVHQDVKLNGNPIEAFRNAFDQLDTKTEDKTLAPVSPKVNAVVASIDQEKLVNDLANTGYWLGQKAANALYFGEANSTIESEDIEMLKTSKDVRKIISNETRKIARVRPNAAPRTLEVLVKNRLKQYTYLGGNLVAPLENGKNIREVMGLPESTEESYTPNTALKKYFDRPDFVDGLDKLLTAERQGQQNWWDNLEENIGEAVSNVFGNLGTNFSDPFVKKQNKVVRDFDRVSTLPYKIDVDNNGKAIVNFYYDTERTKAYTQPIVVDLKEVGDWYNTMLKNELRPE